MTKREFYERFWEKDVEFEELYEFCRDYSLYEYGFELLTYNDFSTCLEDRINDMLSYCTWREMRDFLDDIPVSDWYVRTSDDENEEACDENDIPRLIKAIEELVEEIEGDTWYEDLPDGELYDDEEEYGLEIEMLFGS